MNRKSGKLSLLLVLAGIAIFNIFRDLDTVHRVVNLFGLLLIIYASSTFKLSGMTK